MFRFPSKTNSIDFLKSIGVKFGTIIDVGTHAETPELRIGFPEQKHILFEPAEEFFDRINENYQGMDYELVPLAVSNCNGIGRLHKIAIDGGEISHSKLDSSSELAEVEADPMTIDIATVRLDSFFQDRADPLPYLLKVDVDGFEMPILEGAEGIWDRIDCVIVEATAETFLDRFQYVATRGFHLFDVIDICYYSGVFSQADLVFVSDRLRSCNDALRPWETQEFAWEKWVPIGGYESIVKEKV